MRMPRVFIGSSVEGLNVGRGIIDNLEHDVDATLWTGGTFKLASTPLADLVEKAHQVDFAIFVFSPDDVTTIRSQSTTTVRDNVIFELGLFVGALGKDRCFIVQPRDTDLRMPSDLLGVNTAGYKAGRNDGDLSSALNYASNRIRERVVELGCLDVEEPVAAKRIDLNVTLGNTSDSEHGLLAVILEGSNESQSGFSIFEVRHRAEALGINSPEVDILMVKLERAGLIQRNFAYDFNGNEYGTVSITDHGIDIVLKHYDTAQGDLPF